MVLTTCRCGTELVVVHGGLTKCPHCDSSCRSFMCARCAKLAHTCNDCRQVYPNERARAECERTHR